MLHLDKDNNDSVPELKQIELNTISSAFSSLGTTVSRLHTYLMNRHSIKMKGFLPVNSSMEGVPLSIAIAHKAYIKEFGLPDQLSEHSPRIVVVMVVQKGEKNSVDQRMIQFKLWENYSIRLVRYALDEIADKGKIDEKNRHIHVDGNLVTVFYFRAGYTPSDYPTEKVHSNASKFSPYAALCVYFSDVSL